ncbi:MAG: hypothetical protein ACLT98_10575 [Eggerthellaceae bacterium]
MTKPDFEQYNRIEIPRDEAYAANLGERHRHRARGYPTVLKAVQTPATG